MDCFVALLLAMTYGFYAVRAGHSGLLYPRGTEGRAQRAGVSDI